MLDEEQCVDKRSLAIYWSMERPYTFSSKLRASTPLCRYLHVVAACFLTPVWVRIPILDDNSATHSHRQKWGLLCERMKNMVEIFKRAKTCFEKEEITPSRCGVYYANALNATEEVDANNSTGKSARMCMRRDMTSGTRDKRSEGVNEVAGDLKWARGNCRRSILIL